MEKQTAPKMDFKEIIQASILLRNNTPLDEFEGLTPTEVHSLLYHTLTYKSPVQLKQVADDSTLDQVPFFRLAEELLRIIHRDKFIKLTPLGALPKKVMVEVYAHGFLPDEHIESGIVKLHREQDCISISAARFATEYAGLIKKAHGKLSLTKLGEKLLQSENRPELFTKILLSFTRDFNWGFHDGYPNQPIGQLGWAFTLYLLFKYGREPRTVTFYADKYLTAFPVFITFFQADFSTPKKLFIQCFHLRTFERFLLWFGFVSVQKQKKHSDPYTNTYSCSELMECLFMVE